jgi:hypothetical protein
VALVLLSYFALMFLKILQWLRDNHTISDLSIRRLAFYVRKHILVETITVILKTMKILASKYKRVRSIMLDSPYSSFSV